MEENNEVPPLQVKIVQEKPSVVNEELDYEDFGTEEEIEEEFNNAEW